MANILTVPATNFHANFQVNIFLDRWLGSSSFLPIFSSLIFLPTAAIVLFSGQMFLFTFLISSHMSIGFSSAEMSMLVMRILFSCPWSYLWASGLFFSQESFILSHVWVTIVFSIRILVGSLLFSHLSGAAINIFNSHFPFIFHLPSDGWLFYG